MDSNKDIFTLYGSDDVKYLPYDKGEADAIIIPAEVNVSVKKKQLPEKKASSFIRFLNSFLDFAESLGEMYIRIFKSAKNKPAENA